jgi:two-component sensor histidine kinase
VYNDLLRTSQWWNACRVTRGTVPISARRKTVTWEYRLSPHARSVGEARRHVRYALGPYGDPETLDRIQLVVSELVTNAVKHGPGKPITLRLVSEPDGGIWGEVVDHGNGAVAIREQEIGGLGLPIVDALTTAWGVCAGSTRVWFRF